jgi:hypothetical protein
MEPIKNINGSRVTGLRIRARLPHPQANRLHPGIPPRLQRHPRCRARWLPGQLPHTRQHQPRNPAVRRRLDQALKGRAMPAKEVLLRLTRQARTSMEECLDHILIMNTNHLKRVLVEYSEYYNTSRPHQGIDQQTPIPYSTSPNGTIHRRKILGGIINDYYRSPALTTLPSA